MIANETERESVEDQNIIEKERRIAKKVANNEEIDEVDTTPSLKMACAHPRNVHDIASDLRNNYTVRSWFASRQTNCSCHGSSIGHLQGKKRVRREEDSDGVVEEGEPLSKIGSAGTPVVIRILPRDD